MCLELAAEVHFQSVCMNASVSHSAFPLQAPSFKLAGSYRAEQIAGGLGRLQLARAL